MSDRPQEPGVGDAPTGAGAGEAGHEVSIQVTSALQANAGKMIFGKLAKAEK
ncbi:MAG: hypothetical protein VX675_02705 [Planctomycetota bacterium]|nr:hypothetical protein [Planctomycetota bacterium]MEC9353597.1 hypothetical protein [Planctomycetota bacterium]